MTSRLLNRGWCLCAFIAYISLPATSWASRYGDIQSWVVGRFESHSFLVGEKEYSYRLFRPDGAPSARELHAGRCSGAPLEGALPGHSNNLKLKKWPVLLWLHGQGESGNDNRSQLKWMEMLFKPTGNELEMFIVAPQQAAGSQGWFRSGIPTSDEPLTLALKALDDAMAKYPLDENRVYLSGVSSGGTACLELALRQSGRFAAVAPLASSASNITITESLAKIPIWVFHSRTDQAPTSASASRFVDALNKGGGHAWFTETDPPYDDVKRKWDDHNCWTSAFGEHHLTEWLLQQRRGSGIWRPGAKPWAWWQAPAWLGVLGLLSFAWWSERLRKAKIQGAVGVTGFKPTRGDT